MKRQRSTSSAEFDNDGEIEMDSAASRTAHARRHQSSVPVLLEKSGPTVKEVSASGLKTQWWKGQAGLDFKTNSTKITVNRTTRTKPEMNPADAAMHGLDFIYCMAQGDDEESKENFVAFGTLILQTFNDLSSVTMEPIRSRCLELLKHSALWWRDFTQELPIPEDGEEPAERNAALFDQLVGLYSVERAGLQHDLKMKLFDELQRTTRPEATVLFDFDPEDYLDGMSARWRDENGTASPSTTVKPSSSSSSSTTSSTSTTTAVTTATTTAAPINPVKLKNALTAMFYADALALSLHATPYAKCLSLVGLYHPYSLPTTPTSDDVNLATTVIMTLSNYGEYRLLPTLLPHEYRLLCSVASFRAVLERGEIEEVAKRILCVKILGGTMVLCPSTTIGTTTDDEVQFVGEDKARNLLGEAENLLLQKQNPRGDWVSSDDDPNNPTEIFSQFSATRWATFSLCRLRFRGWGPAPSGCGAALESWRRRGKGWTVGGGGGGGDGGSGGDGIGSGGDGSGGGGEQQGVNTFGLQLYPESCYDHIALHYDHERQQKLLFSTLPLRQKSNLRMAALVDWKNTDHGGDEKEEEEDGDVGGIDSSGKGEKRMGSFGSRRAGSSKKRRSLLLENSRVVALRKLCSGTKSKHAFISRLLSSIKKWECGGSDKYLQKRNQLIESVDEEGRVDIAGNKVSLFDLFKHVAPLGGLQIQGGLTSYEWLTAARHLLLPETVSSRGTHIRKLYTSYFRKYENDKIDALLSKTSGHARVSASSSSSSSKPKVKDLSARKSFYKSEPTLTEARHLYNKTQPWTGSKEFEGVTYKFTVNMRKVDQDKDSSAVSQNKYGAERRILYHCEYEDKDKEDMYWWSDDETDVTGLFNKLDLSVRQRIEPILQRKKTKKLVRM